MAPGHKYPLPQLSFWVRLMNGCISGNSQVHPRRTPGGPPCLGDSVVAARLSCQPSKQCVWPWRSKFMSMGQVDNCTQDHLLCPAKEASLLRGLKAHNVLAQKHSPGWQLMGKVCRPEHCILLRRPWGAADGCSWSRLPGAGMGTFLLVGCQRQGPLRTSSLAPCFEQENI